MRLRLDVVRHGQRLNQTKYVESAYSKSAYSKSAYSIC